MKIPIIMSSVLWQGRGDKVKDRGRNSVCQRAGKQMGDGTDPGCGYGGNEIILGNKEYFCIEGQPE